MSNRPSLIVIFAVAPFVAICVPTITLLPDPVARITPPFCSISAWIVW